MADSTEKTIASELREGASELRRIGGQVGEDPWRWEGRYPQRITNAVGEVIAQTLTAPGETPYLAQWITLVGPQLAEPLASWLENAADTVDELGVHPVLGPGSSALAALAVARAVNGTTP